MRKNKALLKRAASLFTALVMLAGSATYAQEEQTSQEVLSQECCQNHLLSYQRN